MQDTHVSIETGGVGGSVGSAKREAIKARQGGVVGEAFADAHDG